MVFRLFRIANSPSKTLAAWCAAVLVGSAAHAVLETPWFTGHGAALAVAAAFGAIAIGAASGRRARLALIAAGLSLLSVARYDAALASRIDAVRAAPPEEMRDLTGIVRAAPAERTDRTVLRIEGVIDAASGAAYPGIAQVTLKPDAAVPAYGDRIAFRCAPEPVAREKGGYHAYLFARRVAWTCRASFVKIGANEAGPIGGAIHAFRARMFRTATDLYHEPYASMVLGLLIGAEEGLPRELSDAFRDSGTSHILAVSGSNVVQLVRLMILMLGVLRIRKRSAAAATAGTIAAFAVLVGDDASVVRAAIMGCVMVLASALERRYSGSVALPLAAALMLLTEPLSLRHDLGFALSFAAVIGLHTLASPASVLLGRVIPLEGVARTLGETSAATIATLPIILIAFGRVPVLGLLANVIILPVIPFIMLLGATSLLAGAIFLPLALPFVVLATGFTVPVLAAARLFASGADLAVTAELGVVSATALSVATATLCLACAIMAHRKKVRPYAPV